MLVSLDSLWDLLPSVAADSHLPLHTAHKYRVNNISPFAIVSGIIGTLISWFTQRQLNNLRDCLDKVQD